MVLAAPWFPKIHEKFCCFRLSLLVSAVKMAFNDVINLVLNSHSSNSLNSTAASKMAGELYKLIGVVICACVFIFLLLVVQAILVFRKLKPKSSRKARNGIVVLHQMPPNYRVLSVSPPCLKLETYLRMNKIPYESEYSFNMSSKGKVPWIEYNGSAVADSNFIIRFLNQEFQFDPDAHLSVVEKAMAHSMLVTLQENTYWYESLSIYQSIYNYFFILMSWTLGIVSCLFIFNTFSVCKCLFQQGPKVGVAPGAGGI